MKNRTLASIAGQIITIAMQMNKQLHADLNKFNPTYWKCVLKILSKLRRAEQIERYKAGQHVPVPFRKNL